ncbi:MAG: 2-hydroxyacid dehydrogenase, partial [Candidatus Hodarchaeota archaeon]
GLGRIGEAVAMRARGFGMKVLYSSRTPKPEFEAKFGRGIQAVTLETLLQKSDIITIHAPLTAATKGMIGRQQFSLIKPSAILINTARGPIVDEAALCSALESGQLAGAGLDVFCEEPINSRNPLLKLKNLVVAPHIGSATKETREKMVEIVVENIQAHFEGRKPPTLVNMEVLR